MKTVFSGTLKALIAAILLSGATSNFADSHLHSVTGSGLTAVPADFWFPGSIPYFHETSISARQEADGSASGSLILKDWSQAAGHFIAVCEVHCLSVSGNSAYFGAVIRFSSDPSFAGPGTELVGYVTDIDAGGTDISWFGPAFLFLQPGEDCSVRPAMRQVPITSGNFVVR